MDKRKTGLIDKFTVIRNDGQSAQGKKHHGCQYFVLDIDHDPHAIPALSAYAGSCAEDYPFLAADLQDITGIAERRQRIRRDDQLEDLVLLVARLARSLNNANPGSALAAKAVDYLKRKGHGNPLRDAGEPT